MPREVALEKGKKKTKQNTMDQVPGPVSRAQKEQDMVSEAPMKCNTFYPMKNAKIREAE